MIISLRAIGPEESQGKYFMVKSTMFWHFFPVVLKMVLNINIIQGIVSKWQGSYFPENHYNISSASTNHVRLGGD